MNGILDRERVFERACLMMRDGGFGYPQPRRRELREALWMCGREWSITPETDPQGKGVMLYYGEEAWEAYELLLSKHKAMLEVVRVP